MPGAISIGVSYVGAAAEEFQHVHRIEDRIERPAIAIAALAPRTPTLFSRCVFLLQPGRIEHHHARQFARRRGGDDLAAKATLGEQRQAPAMIEMGVGEQDEVDRRRLEAEGVGVVLGEFAAALEHAAIDEDALSRAFDQVTGTGDRAVGAME